MNGEKEERRENKRSVLEAVLMTQGGFPHSWGLLIDRSDQIPQSVGPDGKSRNLFNMQLPPPPSAPLPYASTNKNSQIPHFLPVKMISHNKCKHTPCLPGTFFFLPVSLFSEQLKISS